MYPSEEDPDYGIFVKKISKNLINNGVIISANSVIEGRPKNFFQKIIKYLVFYFSIIFKYYSCKYDLIYVHFVSHASPVLVLLNIMSCKKRIIVSNVHGSDIIIHNKGIFKLFISSLLKASSLIIVPSPSFFKVIQHKFTFIDSSKIFISPSGGIDRNIFKPLKIKTDSVLKIGFVSRIEEEKGWKTLLKSLKYLKEEGELFKCHFVGKGSQAELLKKLIIENNLSNQISFLGVLNHHDLNKFYNSLDVLVFPTEANESLGLVGLEAMSCGKPVIGSNIAGLKTYIEDGFNGFLFTPGDISELKDAILKFQNLPPENKHLMKMNAISTSKLYDNQKVSLKLFERFKKLLKES